MNSPQRINVLKINIHTNTKERKRKIPAPDFE